MSDETEVLELAQGKVVVERSQDRLSVQWLNTKGPSTELLRFDPVTALIQIWPKMPASNPSRSRFQDQYSKVKELQIDASLLEDWSPQSPVEETEMGDAAIRGLPPGFGRLVSYGLGFPRVYRGFVRLVERHTGCKRIQFGSSDVEGVDGDLIRIGLKRFHQYKHTVDINRDRGSRVVSRINETETRNLFSDLLSLQPKEVSEGRHPIIRAITRAVTENTPLDAVERQSLIRQMAAESNVIARANPREFGKLRNDIELVALHVLIEQFRNGLIGPNAKSESKWQEFFENNSFALQQLFSSPVALYGSQLHLSIPNAQGRGGRIADFVLVNPITRTIFVVEIKTPVVPLVGPRYRGSDQARVFPPHPELAGAIAQVQGQIDSAQADFQRLVTNTPGLESIESCVVRGAIIVGTASGLDVEEQQSFARFRNGLSEIEIVTFDEVLQRLVNLDALLSSTSRPEQSLDSRAVDPRQVAARSPGLAEPGR